MVNSCFMNPKQRSMIFLGITFALMAPYMGFVVYFALRFPPNHLPSWFINTIAFWFIANFLLVSLLAKKLFRRQQIDPRPLAEQNRAKTVLIIVRIVGSYLVIVWTGFFLYGVKETAQGKLPLSRAIPAGAFLLFFIGIFSWGILRSWRR